MRRPPAPPALLAAALLACAPVRDDEARPEGAPVADDAATPETSETSPADPGYALMVKLCSTPCAGSHASVRVFRTDRGELARLRLDGDPEVCSHPPRYYFDAAGTVTATIPARPVTPGSPEAEALAAEQRAQVEGLQEAELLSCFDGARCLGDRVLVRSIFACRSDSDCVDCDCAAVNRSEFDRRGGPAACNIPDQECSATNPACCAGQCVLAR